ncbi:MAG: haloacid dehalogenase type II [Bacteroidota bacterium]
MVPPRVLLFDVNETLLDLAALRPHFERVFGANAAGGMLPVWFARLLHASTVCTLTEAYTDFGTLAGETLQAMADDLGVALSPVDREAVLTQMQHLDPHPDVVPALERLKAAGYRLAALTNSAQAVADAQLHHAGLHAYFEAVFSVESVERFKPAAEPYRWAAGQLGGVPADLRMVAAHDWDIHGALRAGLHGAYVARQGKTYRSHYNAPDVVGRDLAEVTALLLEGTAP